MKKAFKSFFYIIACAAVFVVLIKVYNNSFSSSTAIAFEWKKQVNVYFSNSKMGSDDDCSKVFPVSRIIINAETLGPGSLEALLKGPSDTEKKSGYFTNLNEEILLQRFEIVNKIAYIDFNARFNEGVGGSCRVMGIRSQIETTLNSLPDIDATVISVGGQTEGILEP